MAKIGRRKKGSKQGTSSYMLKAKPCVSPSPSPPSVKRQRIHYKRNGGPDQAVKLSLAMELQQCANPLNTSLRHAIYYFFIHRLDAPHEEHWGGKEGTIAIIRRALQLPPHSHR